MNENGVILFDNRMLDLTFEPFPLNETLIAPYWADVDTTSAGSIWYRETNETEILDRARREIQSAFFDANQQIVNTTHLFIVTWDEVGYFSLGLNQVPALELKIDFNWNTITIVSSSGSTNLHAAP